MSKGMRTVVLALMVAIGLNSGNMAKADLIPVDDAVFGIGSITRDTGTGLDWLNLTLSVGRSFNDINSKFGVGAEFEGFRHASGADLAQFFTNAGIPDIDLGFTLANVVPVLDLLGLWGSLIVGPSTVFSEAVTSNVAAAGTHRFGELNWLNAGVLAATPVARAASQAGFIVDTAVLQGKTGHALIRETPTAVPEPATSVLLLSGLVMVGGLAAKRKRAREKRRSSRL